MQPLVSIIIPVYNSEFYLKRCLDSVSNQTYSNLEIICINDGSTDNSLGILNEYASRDTRFKVITTKNAGQGAARNVGLRHVTGKWVTGVDSDDYLEPDACAYAISHVSDDIDIIQIGALAREVGKSDVFHRGRIDGKISVSAEILIDQPCEFWGKFWRKTYLDKYRCSFPEGLWYEDWFFYWAYLPYARNILYLPECKYVYVKRSTSTMGKSHNKSVKVFDHVIVLKQLLDYRQAHPLEASFSCLNLINFLHCVNFIGKNLPDKLIDDANNVFKNLVTYSILLPWKKWIKSLTYNSAIDKRSFFVRYNLGEISFGICSFYPLKVRLERDWIVWRLFGFRIVRYKAGLVE